MVKKLLQLLFVLFVSGMSVSSFAFASSWEIEYFDIEIISSEDWIDVWDSVSYQISAVDKYGDVVTDYLWEIIVFSEKDRYAKFLWIDNNVYKFQSSDEWIAVFEKGVIFSMWWMMDIHVYDIADQTGNVLWIGEVKVWPDVSYSYSETEYSAWKRIFWINEAHHFQIEVTSENEKLEVWEWYDLKIDVMNIDWDLLTNYEWTLLMFSETDHDMVIEGLEDNVYRVHKSDNWSVTFVWWVSFSKIWTHDIHVYDLGDETNAVMWMIEVDVEVENSSIVEEDTWLYEYNSEVDFTIIKPYISAIDKRLESFFKKNEEKSYIEQNVFYNNFLEKLYKLSESWRYSDDKVVSSIIEYITKTVEGKNEKILELLVLINENIAALTDFQVKKIKRIEDTLWWLFNDEKWYNYYMIKVLESAHDQRERYKAISEFQKYIKENYSVYEGYSFILETYITELDESFNN